jgi:thioesterase domain-containing protein/acyl carrier protein
MVRGPQVFEGYENHHEANDESFADGWFRTGDEGYFDEDGYLTLTGRIKEMINRGGEKVNPAEVDEAVRSHPGVRDAACFPIPHPTLGEEVAVAVVLETGAEVTRQELTEHLLKRLAAFKVPRRYVFVDAIPRTGAGKVQRYRLAEVLGVGEGTAPGPSDEPGRAPTALEARLQAIWARTLNVKGVGLDDNFFLLGGDSLRAVELFLAIERELGRNLPVAALFEAGTVAEMARLIESEEPPGCVVAIQPGGDRPPFFCVHGNGGHVIGFHALAKHLGPDQPFYGIQSVGWDGEAVPFTSSEAMAAHYVAELRKVQPRGPYYLGGYSFGGRLVCYMANMLKAAGEEVALLALLDPISYAGRQFATLGIWLERHGAPGGPRRVLETGRYLWFRVRKGYDWLYAWLRRAALFALWGHYRHAGRKPPRFLRRPDWANRMIRLEHARMPPWEGDAVQFRAQPGSRAKSHPDVRDSWDRLIRGRLEVVHVPGLHHQIIKEPYVATLAHELAKALEASRATRISRAAE